MKANAKLKFLLLTGFTAVLGIASVAMIAPSFGGAISISAEGEAEEDPYAGRTAGVEEAIPDGTVVFSCASATRTPTTETFALVGASTPPTVCYNNGTRYNNVWVRIKDDSFDGTLPSGLKENLPTYNAEVYAIFDTKSDAKVVIPETLTRAGSCIFNVTGIASNVFTDAFSGITDVYIPSGITTIETGAFAGIPDTVNIHCEVESKPVDWSTGWDGGSTHVNWNVARNGGFLTSTQQKAITEGKSAASRSFGVSRDFFAGYHGEGNLRQPIYVSYDVLDGNGAKVRSVERQELPKVSPTAIYDGLGSFSNESINYLLVCDINGNEHIDGSTLVVHNILDAKKVTHEDGSVTYDPQTDYPYFAKVRLLYSEVLKIEDLAEITPTSVSTFAGYTQFNVNIDRSVASYALLNAKVYEARKEEIESGTLQIRSQFVSLNSASYRITYLKNGVETVKIVPIDLPITFVQIGEMKGNNIGFILTNSDVDASFTADSLVKAELINFYLHMDVYNPTLDSIVARSAVNLRFGAIALYEGTAGNVHGLANLDVIITVIAVAYALLYTAGAIGYYFYAKNRFKNDEFRRVNKKRYTKKAIINGFGYGLITMAITFIIARWGVMNTSIVSYNPLDALVIGFGVCALVFAGIAIKNAVVAIKEARKRAETIRLKLNEDVADDGTK